MSALCLDVWFGVCIFARLGVFRVFLILCVCIGYLQFCGFGFGVYRLLVLRVVVVLPVLAFRFSISVVLIPAGL